MDFLQKEKEGIAQNLFVQLQQIEPIIFQEELQIQAPTTNFCNSSFQGHNNGGCRGERNGQRERELLFEKVVTPSDVGKLNRLVIPKQFAEKYFPLDSSTNEKGLFLSFEDRNGQQWRFRYSYWKSSQSFVMTRGWSRFVKDKKLHAGDVVSFERYVAEMGKNSFHFRIDWKHRSDIVLRQRDLHFQGKSPKFNLPNLRFDSFHNLNPLSAASSQRSMPVMEPVTQIRHCRSSEAKPKQLRLFGVNLDCPEEPKRHAYSRFESSSSSSLSPNETPLLQTETQLSSGGKASAFFPFHWNP